MPHHVPKRQMVYCNGMFRTWWQCYTVCCEDFLLCNCWTIVKQTKFFFFSFSSYFIFCFCLHHDMIFQCVALVTNCYTFTCQKSFIHTHTHSQTTRLTRRGWRYKAFLFSVYIFRTAIAKQILRTWNLSDEGELLTMVLTFVWIQKCQCM